MGKQTTPEPSNYFSDHNQRFKKVCPLHVCPTDCTSMFYVSKKNRWCYDENYKLKSDQHERVRVQDGEGKKKTSNVMTGIISHMIDKSGDGLDMGIYEKNLTKYTEFLADDRMLKGVERVAYIYKINANSLTASLLKELKE